MGLVQAIIFLSSQTEVEDEQQRKWGEVGGAEEEEDVIALERRRDMK